MASESRFYRNLPLNNTLIEIKNSKDDRDIFFFVKKVISNISQVSKSYLNLFGILFWKAVLRP